MSDLAQTKPSKEHKTEHVTPPVPEQAPQSGPYAGILAMQSEAGNQAVDEQVGSSVPDSVQDTLQSPGQPLDPATRSDMEARFGRDFSRVRIHTDRRAVESAKSVRAQAYTVRSQIVFGSGKFRPWTDNGRRLLTHELAHVVQQRNLTDDLLSNLSIGSKHDQYEQEADAAANVAENGVSAHGSNAPQSIPTFPLVQRAPEEKDLERVQQEPIRTSGREDEVSGEYTEPGWTPVNELGIVRVEEAEASIRGARLRPEPSTKKKELHLLKENTKVFIISENTESKWIFVSVANKEHRGERGYISSDLVWQQLPDPEAVLYYVAQSGLGLQKLVENHEQYKNYDIRTGDDARSIVVAVLAANDADSRTKGHVYLNPEKYEKAKDVGVLETAMDKLDEYRAVTRPILQSVELQKGEKIWLPGKAYIESLKNLGIIPTRPEWKNFAIGVAKGIGGFISGIVDGFSASIVDLFVGIYELIKSVMSLVIDIITGDIVDKAKKLYDTIEGMSAEELLKLLKDAVAGLASTIFNNFANKWDANSPYKRWHFRGYVIGYIAAEVLMFIFSGGASIAKWLGKLGKVGKTLARILKDATKRAKKALDKVRPKRKVSKRDIERPGPKGSREAKEWPTALGLAKAMAETHDKKDSPTSLALATLRPLKGKFRWIKRFGAVRISPGHYKIYMYGSKYTVDHDYTTGIDEIFEEAGQKGTPTDQPEGTGKVISADTARKKVVHDLGVDHGKIKAVKDGLSPVNPRTGRAWSNPYEFDGPFGKGIDDIMFDSKGNPVIIEYKGGLSQLTGDQMKPAWIRRKIKQLRSRNDPMADILQKALDEKKLTGRVYRTPVSEKGLPGKTVLEELIKY